MLIPRSLDDPAAQFPQTENTVRLLDQWKELLKNSSPDTWLFPSEAGSTPISYSNVYRYMRPALANVGLGGVNFQILRRTWVTEFSEVIDDPNVRAHLAGHSVDVHENEYRQPKTAVLKRPMRKMGKHLQ